MDTLLKSPATQVFLLKKKRYILFVISHLSTLELIRRGIKQRLTMFRYMQDTKVYKRHTLMAIHNFYVQ